MKRNLLIAAAGSAALLASVAIAQDYGSQQPAPAQDTSSQQPAPAPDTSSQQAAPADTGANQAGFEDAGERG